MILQFLAGLPPDVRGCVSRSRSWRRRAWGGSGGRWLAGARFSVVVAISVVTMTFQRISGWTDPPADPGPRAAAATSARASDAIPQSRGSVEVIVAVDVHDRVRTGEDGGGPVALVDAALVHVSGPPVVEVGVVVAELVAVAVTAAATVAPAPSTALVALTTVVVAAAAVVAVVAARARDPPASAVLIARPVMTFRNLGIAFLLARMDRPVSGTSTV